MMVNVGQSVSATVSVSSSGPTGQFYAQGLPVGVVGTFSPASCPSSCTTTLTLTAAPMAMQLSTVFLVSAGYQPGAPSTNVALTVIGDPFFN